MWGTGDNLEELAQRAGVDQDPRIRALIDSPLLLGEKRQKLAKFLRPLAARQCPRPHAFLPAPTREQAQAGTIPLAPVVTGRGPEYFYMLKQEEISGGILLGSPPGGGKTVLLNQLGTACHRQGIPVWWHDSEGDLTAHVVRAAPDVLIPGYRLLRQELFEACPEMKLEWREYLSKAISSWRAPLFLGDGMANMAREIAIELHERIGHLTPYEFVQELQRKKHRLSSREGNYYEALKNRFEGMILPVLGSTYSGGSHDMATMLKRSLVWQLQGLADDVMLFFVTQLLLAVSLIRPVEPGLHLASLQICDEFTRFCNMEHMRRATAGEIFMLDFVRTCRKRGIGLVIATQTPHLLPPQVLSDMNTWIVFRPIDGRFLQCVSQALSLDADQEEALMGLSDRHPRQAIVRTPGIPNPFLIEIPQFETEWATPWEIAQRAEETKVWLDSIYQPPVRPGPPKTSDQKSEGPLFTPQEHQIPKATLDYLVRCARDWATPVTARDQKHNISASVGSKHRKRLIDEGFIRAHRILTGQRGGQLQVTEVTEQGYQELERFDVHVPRPPGRGGFEHRLWQHIVHSWAVAAMGYPAQIEQEVAGKPVDVGVIWEEKRVAVEIVVEGIEKELDNFGKDLAAGWDQVIFAAVEQATLDQLRDRILDTFNEEVLVQDKVAFRRLCKFLQAPSPSPNGSGDGSNADTPKG